ncbi:MAG: DNA translocase FtsK [Firmicutes bacterium]|nr:DNA translocase FtsK [Bacillota bacterium]
MASKKKVNQKKLKKTFPFKNEFINRQITSVIMMALAVFLFAGIQFTAQTGYLGLLLNNILRTLLGDAALALPFLFAAIALTRLWPLEIENIQYRFLGLAILFLLLTITLHLTLSLEELAALAKGNIYTSMIYLGLQQQGGGLLGAVLTVILFFLFKDIGSYIIIVALGILALLLITNSSIVEIFSGFFKYSSVILSFSGRLGKNIIGFFPQGEKIAGSSSSKKYPVKKYDDYVTIPSVEEKEENAGGFLEKKYNNFNNEAIQQTILTAEEVLSEDVPAEGVEANGSLNNLIGENKTLEDYKIPPLNLLVKVNKLRDYQQQKVIQERAKSLESTFDSFGVNVKIKEIQAGPAVTRFEIQPETGVKVSKILSLSDDLALNLAAPDVRIEAPIPGKAAIGIEVPNKIISLVYLRDVLEDPFFYSSASPLTVGLGKDIAGSAVFADLLKMPHLLIAGSTGSGKSVCINALISSILFKATPWEVKLLLIDPKLVELSIYNGIPHLISPVITEPKKASMALRSMVKEMERRYDLFARQGVRDISRYNELLRSSVKRENSSIPEDCRAEELLPYIVVVIDELADLMMVAPAEVEDSIVRLSQMSRAAGIHLVIATQRPSVDIITGLIKANITSRIAFAVSSQIDSRTILDLGGAEKLLGRGDMLYYPIGVHKPLRVQGAYISERDIIKLVEYIRQQESPLYQQSFFTEEVSEVNIKEEKNDPLLPEAVELVLQTGHASISLIQRRFRVGYARAARLVDDLERLGVVGKFEGSKPRKVLMNMEQAAVLLKDIVNKSDNDE